ncbi:MAG TPA: alpha/beta fold hydrolase, partial [Thermoanaerobaculia bacterium]|nr:alpha/beta fold hydrolase [Thermoanaerobaculia bacterium]
MRNRAVAVALVLAAGFFPARALFLRAVEKRTFDRRRNGPETPAGFGLSFADVPIQSGERRLRAFFVHVPPRPSKRPRAVLLLHGNGETISQWVRAQKVLADSGVSSLVFDYSGFGDSTGVPTSERVSEDGRAAYGELVRRMPPDSLRVAYGLSLGAAVVLKIAPALDPPPSGVVVWGAWPSAREVVKRLHTAPAWLVPLLPNAFDNPTAARDVKVPLLVLHGSEDKIATADDGKRIAGAASHGRLVEVPGGTHNAPHETPDTRSWKPVIDFFDELESQPAE